MPKTLGQASIVAALMVPFPAVAAAVDPAPPSAAERRLSPEQVEAVLAEAAKKREAAELRAVSDAGQAPPRPIQGEVGMSVGTGGYREVSGTAVLPLGHDGAAAVSLDFVDLGRRRYKR